jgi:hypothetical protein
MLRAAFLHRHPDHGWPDQRHAAVSGSRRSVVDLRHAESGQLHARVAVHAGGVFRLHPVRTHRQLPGRGAGRLARSRRVRMAVRASVHEPRVRHRRAHATACLLQLHPDIGRRREDPVGARVPLHGHARRVPATSGGRGGRGPAGVLRVPDRDHRACGRGARVVHRPHPRGQDRAGGGGQSDHDVGARYQYHPRVRRGVRAGFAARGARRRARRAGAVAGGGHGVLGADRILHRDGGRSPARSPARC